MDGRFGVQAVKLNQLFAVNSLRNYCLKALCFAYSAKIAPMTVFWSQPLNMKPTEISHLIAQKQTKPLLLPSDFKALQITTMCSETQVHPLIYTQ